MDTCGRYVGLGYPSDCCALRRLVRGALGGARVPWCRGLVAVVPHAPYELVADVYAAGYAVLDDDVDVVAVVAPDHYASASEPRVLPPAYLCAGCYRVRVCGYAVNVLLNHGLAMDTRLSTIDHAVELQVPWLAERFPGACVAVITIPWLDEGFVETVAKALSALYDELGGKLAVVATTDMTHYADHETVDRLDNRAIDLLRENRLREFMDYARERLSWCGAAAVAAAARYAKLIIATHLEVVARKKVEIAGMVNGYAALAWCREKPLLG